MAQKFFEKFLINLKKIIPRGVFNFFSPFYHKALAYVAAFFYGWPAEKMIVIGVTGTNGKSTTVTLVAEILEKAGFKVGSTSTVNFKVASKVWLNDTKMTMLGRFQLQKMLCQMVKADCHYAIIETSSQGISQFRHLGINYDIAVFTNLTPEHLEAHGGFENYKEAKGKLFKHLSRSPRKKINGKKIEKIIIANLDDKQAPYFLNFPVEQKIGYTLKEKKGEVSFNNLEIIKGEKINLTASGSRFEVKGEIFKINLLGQFNVYNALAALAVAYSQDIDFNIIKKTLSQVPGVPGRLEKIEQGQLFTIIVDYAPEPASLVKAYEVIKALPHRRIIHLLGSTGGGRDLSRRPILGRIAAQNADMVIVTNEDPYDDDPWEIINQVAKGAEKAGKILANNLFKILDRREAIKFALTLANEGDLVLLTGKGAEQAMVVKNNQKIPWDDRAVVKEELKKFSNQFNSKIKPNH
jgi:UDP-N-acetylmuramoyl-L-alanyl-D-glutamate--2,6-diaminopimelate ligase